MGAEAEGEAGMIAWYWHSFVDGMFGSKIYVAYGWLLPIPLSLFLAACVLLILRGRLPFWCAVSSAVISYAVWLGLSIGIPPPQM